ncbi:MAG: HIT domain-containing protein [Patescibacteria group bacterium]|nr:HIT domain-containing protein [Patescibacteria group bacterium]
MKQAQYFTDHSADIKKFKYWTLMLHSNQSYLGRSICYLNTYKETLAELAEDEYLELLEIIKQYQTALSKLWHPDGWNYAQLGNVVPHLHVHFIPRYKNTITWEGAVFTDERWGNHYAPATIRAEDKNINKKILRAIQGELDSSTST